jgi:hypothetical protein
MRQDIRENNYIGDYIKEQLCVLTADTAYKMGL